MDPSKCIAAFDALRGTWEGLSEFLCRPTRVALVFAEKENDPLRVFDYHGLLKENKSSISAFFSSRNNWCSTHTITGSPFHIADNLSTQALNIPCSVAMHSDPMFYQCWIAEQTENVCNIEVVNRWLWSAAWILSHDLAWIRYTGAAPETTEDSLRHHSRQAVRRHIGGVINSRLRRDPRINVLKVLDSILGLSLMVEEGRKASGRICFVESDTLDESWLTAAFPLNERPTLNDYKHLCKLMPLSVLDDSCLVADSEKVIGVGLFDDFAENTIVAEFRGGGGTITMTEGEVCSFSNGHLYGIRRKPCFDNLLKALESARVEESYRATLCKVIASIATQAVEHEHGCLLVIDDQKQTKGHRLSVPLDLTNSKNIDLSCQMSIVDGALMIEPPCSLVSFGTILSGDTDEKEDPSRGARFNSAIRYTSSHPKSVAVVASEDGRVSIVFDGSEYGAVQHQTVVKEINTKPSLLNEWLA
jgi:hypothetical protein